MNVAFLIYNRPDLTRCVAERIAAARPDRLLVVADGPKTERDRVACLETRRVIDEIDWPCEVLRNYSDMNLGCRRRVASGLDWVFEIVDECIILEDDCLPAPDFFRFCKELLDRYRHDTRVMHIGGANFQQGLSRTDYSYYFSKYCHIWGWATWKRAWQHYDVEMRNWPEFRELRLPSATCPDRKECAYWQATLNAAFLGRIDTWDYAWLFTCWYKSGLSIVPNVNLVSNLGFGAGATHTSRSSVFAAQAPGELGELRHPPTVVAHHEADRYTFKASFWAQRPSFAERLSSHIPSRWIVGKWMRRVPYLGRHWGAWRRRRQAQATSAI